MRYRSPTAQMARVSRAIAAGGSSPGSLTAVNASRTACAASSASAASRACRFGKWPYRVRRTTPAARAISSRLASGSRLSSSRAAARMRA